jgi:hypothetical protein
VLSSKELQELRERQNFYAICHGMVNSTWYVNISLIVPIFGFLRMVFGIMLHIDDPSVGV